MIKHSVFYIYKRIYFLKSEYKAFLASIFGIFNVEDHSSEKVKYQLCNNNNSGVIFLILSILNASFSICKVLFTSFNKKLLIFIEDGSEKTFSIIEADPVLRQYQLNSFSIKKLLIVRGL